MINIAVLGYGTVGSGVVEVIRTNHELINKRAGEEIKIKYVLDLREFPGDPVEEILVHDFEQIVNDPEVKIVVEVMGGTGAAYTFTKRALEAGKSVCTSNKALVAQYGPELMEIAKEKKINFLFEASCGGGIPIIRAINGSLTADEIDEVSGILNGTTNYMLDKMITEGADFNTVLKEAQEKEQEQYEAMKKRIKFMYEEGDTTALETLVTAENFSDLVNKAEYVQNVHTYDRKQLEEYVETKQQIADLKTTLEDEQKNMESMQAEYEDKESELSSTIESKKAEVADLDSQIQAAAEAAAAEALAAQQQAAANNNGNNNNNNSNRNNNSSGNNNHANNSNSASTGGGTGNTSTAQAIVNAAYGQLGVPYVWGGTTPGVGLDCSGLTQYCHRVAGISIGRTSEVQGGGGRAVSNPQPGDLVCYGSHIGIYIGGGQMIHAPHKGDVVRVANVYGSPWYRRYW